VNKWLLAQRAPGTAAGQRQKGSCLQCTFSVPVAYPGAGRAARPSAAQHPSGFLIVPRASWRVGGNGHPLLSAHCVPSCPSGPHQPASTNDCPQEQTHETMATSQTLQTFPALSTVPTPPAILAQTVSPPSPGLPGRAAPFPAGGDAPHPGDIRAAALWQVGVVKTQRTRRTHSVAGTTVRRGDATQSAGGEQDPSRCSQSALRDGSAARHKTRTVLRTVRMPSARVSTPMITFRYFVCIFFTISAATGVESATPMANVRARSQSICLPAQT